MAGPDALNVCFVDIDFYFQRIHVDDRADAGARETAACRNWRNYFARLSVLGYHNARERRTDHRVVQLVLRHLDASLGNNYVFPSGRQACAKRLGICRCRIEFGLAAELSFEQFGGAS